MKKIIILLFITFSNFFVFSQDNDINDYLYQYHEDDYIIKQGEFSSQNYNILVYSFGYLPNYNEYGENALHSEVFFVKNNKIINNFNLLYMVDNEFSNNILKKQILHDIYKSTFVVSDFNYDGLCEILYLSSNSIYTNYIIETIDKNNIIFNSSEIPLDRIKNISKAKYLFNDSLKFCILNGKRGFCIQELLNKNFSYRFYYWSPKEQKYMLDKSVTQEQIQNAYCPEEYFAYNGLKFSKLDSKLTDEDLKGLDKAQLRLMRNAVYARHGRTFKSVDLQSLWECYNWYEKNPNYSDDLLTEVDKYNIELIQKYEK